MGGNVFKNTHEVVRLETRKMKNVYNEFVIDFCSYTGAFFYKHTLIPSYHEKETHGDMDVIVLSDSEKIQDFLTHLEELEYPHSKNGNIISFLYDPLGYGNFQVDVIIAKNETEYYSSISYFAYNDSGNLRGRIAHSLGLKLGHDGLKYIHREGDQVCFELSLSTDKIAIDLFLGFSERNVNKFWFLGPDTIKDIFEYIASSQYFNPEIFLLHNRNHVSRVRDAKRRTYMLFLKWCENLPKDVVYFEKPKDKSKYQLEAIRHFGKQEEYETKLRETERFKLIKEKFNGEMLMRVTGLQGKELGEFKTKTKNLLPDDLIINISSDTLEYIIEDLYNKLKV